MPKSANGSGEAADALEDSAALAHTAEGRNSA